MQKKRGDEVAVADAIWRSWASRAFKQLGHGARSRCARDCGFQPGQVTKALDGTVGANKVVVQITEWLAREGFVDERKRIAGIATDLLGDDDAREEWLRMGELLARRSK